MFIEEEHNGYVIRILDKDDYNYIFTKKGFVKRGDTDEEHFGYC